MKKSMCFISLCLIIVLFSSCSKNNKQLVNMTAQDNKEYVSILWEDRIYVPFCAVDNADKRNQIGIVNGDKNDQVFEYKDYSPDDWLISFYKSGEMDGSMLMKEINVTAIPDNLTVRGQDK